MREKIWKIVIVNCQLFGQFAMTRCGIRESNRVIVGNLEKATFARNKLIYPVLYLFVEINAVEIFLFLSYTRENVSRNVICIREIGRNKKDNINLLES